MRPQTLAVVLLALVSGLAAVWGVRSLLRKPPPPVEEKVTAIFALADLPQDEPIGAAQVEAREVPKSRAPVGFLSSVDDAVSRIPSITMLKEEPIIEAKLLPKGGKPETIPMVFALADLPQDEPIGAAQVEAREVPKSRAPVGFLSSVDDAVSRIPSSAIPKGESVVESKLLPQESRPDMAKLVSPGMRAFTVQTPKFSPSLAGQVRRDNRVDVLLTPKLQGSGKDDAASMGGFTSSTVIQNIKLLDVHANSQPKDDLDGTNSVTLLVTPRQAAILALAQENGTLQLSLRSNGDEAPAEEVSATIADLLPAPPPILALDSEPEPVVLTVRTLRGTVAGRDQITVLRRGRPGPRRGVGDRSTAAAPAAPAR